MRGTWDFDGFEVALMPGLSPEQEQWERRLVESGCALPLPHRAAWATMHDAGPESWYLSVSDAEGRPCGAVALHGATSRALPGHWIVRCERFGPGLPVGARPAVLRALVEIARQRRRVLRLHVETFAADPGERGMLENQLQALGFSRIRPARSYEHTMLVPLDGDEASIFGSLHATARRHVRAADKNPVEVRPVDDPAYFDRLDEISRETYARTGGAYDPADWSRIVALGAREPSGSRLVGLFRTDVAGPERLLAFAWGCGHGDHVHYSRAGSTRHTDLRMPLMYPVVWDLIRWAKRSGARYFDFGGITLGSHRSDDRLGGISDFKRYFSGRVEEVGAEWCLEPHALQAGAARIVSSASAFVTRVVARSRQERPRSVPAVASTADRGQGAPADGATADLAAGDRSA